MLPVNTDAGHFTGKLVQPQRDIQTLLAGHLPVALDLHLGGGFGTHRRNLAKRAARCNREASREKVANHSGASRAR